MKKYYCCRKKIVLLQDVLVNLSCPQTSALREKEETIEVFLILEEAC